MLLKCPVCGKDFNCAPSRFKKAQTPPCCSRDCAGVQKKNLLELNCTCDFCGKKFHRKPSQMTEHKKYNYCSEECLGNHRKILYQGINNPNAFCRIPIGNKRRHCGYWWVYLPHHPFATKDGYIREHRLIAEQFLLTEEFATEINGEFYLSPEYEVHHKNHNKLDNSPDNLEILTKSEHMKRHGQERKEAMIQYLTQK